MSSRKLDVEKCRQYLASSEFYSEQRGPIGSVEVDQQSERVTVNWQKGAEVYSFEKFIESVKRLAAKHGDKLP